MPQLNGGNPPIPGAVQEVFGCTMLEALDILKNCCEKPPKIPKKRPKKDKKSKEVPAASAPAADGTEVAQIVPTEHVMLCFLHIVLVHVF